ncbi:MAG: hypothetical protein FWD71_15385 [Oscillospiraceae bacterium]|nr:hypothetical protein [Oscillospiraceae bacterium]
MKKSKLPDLDFNLVIDILNKFLNPVFEAIISEKEFFGNWDCYAQTW